MPSKLTPDVEEWLRTTNPALEPVIRRVTTIVLDGDRRLGAYLKNGTLQFAFEGDLAAFVQKKAPRASLMFYRGAAISGSFPHLEGDGPTARFMRFSDLDEVEERADELSAIAAAWCELRS